MPENFASFYRKASSVRELVGKAPFPEKARFQITKVIELPKEQYRRYIHGVESAALDDVFELLAWNQGIGFFSSEIGPSALFQAYKLIKNGEKQGKSREDICSVLREKFGEKNPEMQVMN